MFEGSGMTEDPNDNSSPLCCGGLDYQPTPHERVLRALNAFWENREWEGVDERDRERAAASMVNVKHLLNTESLRSVAKSTGYPTNFIQRLIGVWVEDFPMKSGEQVHVVIHYEEDVFWAEVLEWPGCFAVGKDMTELTQCLRESMLLYADDGKGEAKSLPQEGGCGRLKLSKYMFTRDS